MSFELKGKKRSSSWSNTGWPAVLQLAEDYGWQPAGTQPPRGTKRDSWDGGYCSCDGQRVVADDAKSLAEALERGLADEFKRVTTRTAAASPQTNPEQDRQEAFEKLSALASVMSFEIVHDRAKPGRKPKRGRPQTESSSGDALEAAMTEQGIQPEDLPVLLASLYGGAPDQQDRGEWFTTEDGKQLVRELIKFCREGDFRIS